MFIHKGFILSVNGESSILDNFEMLHDKGQETTLPLADEKQQVLKVVNDLSRTTHHYCQDKKIKQPNNE